MAEWAVLARRRVHGQYVIDRARWGGTNQALARVVAGTPPAALPGVEWSRFRTVADFPPSLTDLDYLSTSVCYRVRTAVTPFLSLWFGLPLAAESAARTAGALLEVHSVTDACRLRARFRRLKGALADAIVTGTLPPLAAAFALVAWVLWIPDRETHLSPPFQL